LRPIKYHIAKNSQAHFAPVFLNRVVYDGASVRGEPEPTVNTAHAKSNVLARWI
jgi:hypothetical protein